MQWTKTLKGSKKYFYLFNIESITKAFSVTDPSVISLSSGVVAVSGRSVQTGLRLLGWNGFSLGLTKRLRGRNEVRPAGLLLGSTLSRATQKVRSWRDAGTLDQDSLWMMLDRAGCWLRLYLVSPLPWSWVRWRVSLFSSARVRVRETCTWSKEHSESWDHNGSPCWLSSGCWMQCLHTWLILPVHCRSFV